MDYIIEMVQKLENAFPEYRVVEATTNVIPAIVYSITPITGDRIKSVDRLELRFIDTIPFGDLRDKERNARKLLMEYGDRVGSKALELTIVGGGEMADTNSGLNHIFAAYQLTTRLI